MILEFEELIGRAKRDVHLKPDEVKFFDNLKVAITGGAGSIGSSLALQLLNETNAKVFLIDSDESRLHTLYVNLPEIFRTRTKTHLADIRDLISIKTALVNIDPTLVIHAAALKHVSVLEASPREAFLTNVFGTANLIDVSRSNGVEKFVNISTDKAANPVSILGKTKLIGEYLTAGFSLKEKSINCGVVRFGNVFLSRGSVLETFAAQIKLGEELTVTDPKMDRFFIDLGEASALILKTIVARHSGVSILKMGKPVRILDLVSRLIDKSGQLIGYRIVGAYPGEKLSEDLFTQNEELESKEYLDYSFTPFTRSLEISEVEKVNCTSDSHAISSIDKLLDASNVL